MKLILRNFALSVVALFGATLIAACSSGHGATPPFTIGGTVSGLTGTVVLHDNGGDNLSVGANGTFTFATKVVSGGAYAVTVAPQPVGQTCVVTAGSGTATANVTTVMVACTNNPYSIGGTASGLTGSMCCRTMAAITSPSPPADRSRLRPTSRAAGPTQ